MSCFISGAAAHKDSDRRQFESPSRKQTGLEGLGVFFIIVVVVVKIKLALLPSRQGERKQDLWSRCLAC